MAQILIWIGIALIVIGWLALSRQAAKIYAVKDELDKFPEKRKAMLLRRTYCRLIILIGIALLMIALLI